jgi:hypothetical protein
MVLPLIHQPFILCRLMYQLAVSVDITYLMSSCTLHNYYRIIESSNNGLMGQDVRYIIDDIKIKGCCVNGTNSKILRSRFRHHHIMIIKSKYFWPNLSFWSSRINIVPLYLVNFVEVVKLQNIQGYKLYLKLL